MNPRIEELRIIPTAEKFIEPFNAAVGTVGRERQYIGYLDTPPMADSHALVMNILAGEGVQFLAVTDNDELVGWCDIVRKQRDGFRHVGYLGMGILAEYRGQGLGERLMRATIDAAVAVGMERIELEVFDTNTRAIALYRKLGFEPEGVKRHARKLEGQYDDDLFMALLIET